MNERTNMAADLEALVREAGETLAHVLVHAGHAMAPEVRARAEKARVACRDFRLTPTQEPTDHE